MRGGAEKETPCALVESVEQIDPCESLSIDVRAEKIVEATKQATALISAAIHEFSQIPNGPSVQSVDACLLLAKAIASTGENPDEMIMRAYNNSRCGMGSDYGHDLKVARTLAEIGEYSKVVEIAQSDPGRPLLASWYAIAIPGLARTGRPYQHLLSHLPDTFDTDGKIMTLCGTAAAVARSGGDPMPIASQAEKLIDCCDNRFLRTVGYAELSIVLSQNGYDSTAILEKARSAGGYVAANWTVFGRKRYETPMNVSRAYAFSRLLVAEGLAESFFNRSLRCGRSEANSHKNHFVTYSDQDKPRSMSFMTTTGHLELVRGLLEIKQFEKAEQFAWESGLITFGPATSKKPPVSNDLFYSDLAKALANDHKFERAISKCESIYDQRRRGTACVAVGRALAEAGESPAKALALASQSADFMLSTGSGDLPSIPSHSPMALLSEIASVWARSGNMHLAIEFLARIPEEEQFHRATALASITIAYNQFANMDVERK